MIRHRNVWGIAMAAAVASCSPYNYAKEVGDFDKSASGLATSVTSGHQAVLDDVAASRRRDLIYNQRRVTFPPSCGVDTGLPKDAPPCAVYRVGGSPIIENPDAIPPKLSAALADLKDYTAALAAVTKASDREELNAAVDKLAKAIGGLAAVVPGGGVAAGTIATAGVNVFGWLVGTALDEQRYLALRDAVRLVDKPIGPTNAKPMDVLSKLIEADLKKLISKRAEQLYSDAADVRAKIGPGIGEDNYRARLTDLEAILAKLEALRKSDPTAARDLATTHKALVDAVNDPKLDLGKLVKELGEFKDKVATLQTALDSASAPAGSGKKG